MPRVAIVQRAIPHYRVGVFNALSNRLAQQHVDLTIFAGQPLDSESDHDARHEVTKACSVKNLYLYGKVHWQPIFSRLREFDLVVFEHANSVLMAHLCLLLRCLRLSGTKIAFWGHGGDLQSRERRGMASALKRVTMRRADFWFAYTELTRRLLVNNGYPDSRIRVLNNSQDVSDIVKEFEIAYPGFRKSFGDRAARPPTAVFCARLTKHRNVPFLYEACKLVRENIPNFRVIFVGSGPYHGWLAERASSHDWMEVQGPKFGRDKAKTLVRCDVMLLPSMVGLSILDGFAAGLPVIAAEFGNHSPEIAYLRDGYNGMLTKPDVIDYADKVSALISGPSVLSAMSANAKATADEMSLEAMVDNYAVGIERALQS